MASLTFSNLSVAGDEVIDIVRGGSTRTISSVALYGKFVYWSDSKRFQIERADKLTGSSE